MTTDPMTTSPVTRLVVAEDEELTRGALIALLNLEDDLEVVGQAADGTEALQQIAIHRPDVAIVDLDMPGLDGIDVCAQLPDGPPVIIVTRHARPGALRRALEARAVGFVTKATSARTLADVIRNVGAGGRYIDPELAAAALVEDDCPLTSRELDVLRAVLPGAPVAEVAAALHLAPGTVRNHLSSAITTLGVATRHEAARVAQERGWL